MSDVNTRASAARAEVRAHEPRPTGEAPSYPPSAERRLAHDLRPSRSGASLGTPSHAQSGAERSLVRARRIASSILVALFSLMGIATADGDGSSSDDPPSNIERLVALEEHLDSGEAYGEGPGAQEIARRVLESFTSEDGVAVQVLEGSPRRIVVLALLPGIESASSAERQSALLGVHDAVDDRDARIAIGLKGGSLLRAILTRAPRQWPPTIDTSPDDPRQVLSAIYEPPAAPRAATPPSPLQFRSSGFRCHKPDQGTCMEYSRTVIPEGDEQGVARQTMEAACTNTGGRFEHEGCPAEGRLGTCNTSTEHVYYYGGPPRSYTRQSAPEECRRANPYARWEPSP